MQDLPNNLEAALKYRVEAGNFNLAIFTGQSDFDKTHPSIVIHAELGQETPINSGNFMITVNCELRQSAETDDLPGFRALARSVYGQLMSDALQTELSSEATDLHVFGILNRQFRETIDDTHWLSVLTFDAYCCRSDL